ncbi:MAG: hypothetical protein H6502_04980 [Candidatus Woesearchaeota archaeon]|nr:MAG: hypothetical protein H6502_04980 [Candidatus Woesearchaeota archaeon]
MDKQANMSLATIIVFVASLLVVTIIVVSIINFVFSQEQSVFSGESRTTNFVSTYVNVMQVYTPNSSSYGNFTELVLLASSQGTTPIRLDGSTIILQTKKNSTSYTYRAPLNSSSYCAASGAAAGCDLISGSQGNFTVEFTAVSPTHTANIVGQGEMFKIYITSPVDITSDERVVIKFVPQRGPEEVTMFKTPGVPRSGLVYLYN